VRIRRKDRSLNLNPFITFILTVQPEVIRKMGQERNLIGIGWMERFLYLLPSSKIGFRSHSNPPVPESLRQEYHQAIKSLLDKFCDPHNPAEPRTLNLTEEASSLWRQFQMGIEIQLRSGGKLHPIKGWGAKICGYALRLAGLIHVMKTDGDELEISAETMETALDLMYNLINHALAAFQLMSVDPKIEKAKRVLDWIVQNDRPQFKQNDIHRSIHGQFSNIDELKDALFQLVDRNCISDPKREETGGRPSIYYEVNPHLINGDR